MISPSSSIYSIPEPSQPQKQKRPKRGNYSFVDNNTRDILIDMVIENNKTIREACTILKLKYTTAKSVLTVYKKNGRVHRLGNCEETRLKNLISTNKLPKTFKPDDEPRWASRCQ
jgi:hypothetical protein